VVKGRLGMKQEPNRASEMGVFIRVVETGGFAHAGRALGLSPSAVSKLITRMEQRLGATLVRRSTRKLALTPEGKLFYHRAVTILAELDAAEREVGGAALPSGRVRINSSASYVTHVLAGILTGFLAQYPDISVDIIQTDALVDLLVEGSDVAIRAGMLPESSLIARSLGQTRMIVAAAPAWVARHGIPTSIANLATGDRLGLAYPRAAEAWIAETNDTPERVRVSDGEGVRRLALAGVAPARLAGFTIRHDLAAGRLVPILTDELPAAFEPFHAVYVGRSGRLPTRVKVLLDYLAVHGRVE
jgi:DNA-binding transcriptional LysR family regulator